MGAMSKRKGATGEREFAAVLRENGFDARRGQQFSGGPNSPDVISEELSWLHFEIKRVEALSITNATQQAESDSGGKPWVVAHRKNNAPWFITIRLDFFFKLLKAHLRKIPALPARK
jgi:Holliday junction resolvase